MPRPRKNSHPDHGRPNLQTVSLLPRRFLILFALAVTIAFIIVLTSASSNTSTLDQLRSSYLRSAQQAKQFFRDHDDLPNLYNPFATGDDAKRPSEQKGAKYRGMSWFEDEQWLIQFSSSRTFDDERVVLPPLPERRAIYTYYDSGDKSADVVASEKKLLLDWRRAWWAHGFRPTVLGKAHAEDNDKMWATLQRSRASAAVKYELERLLAWSQVGGGGVLSNYLAFPMTTQSDRFLSSLRNGTYPDEPTQLGKLSSGLLFANGHDLDIALKLAFADPEDIAAVKRIEDVPGLDVFESSPRGLDSIAIYDESTLKVNYKSIADKLESSNADGLSDLHSLISAHLHNTWQEQYSGISIPKPHPEHMTALTSFAVHISQLLSSCPSNNPLPDSCPPNVLHCIPCSPKTMLSLLLPEHLQPDTQYFRIATIPHPLGFTSLTTYADIGKLSPRFVRRKTPRDEWIHTITSAITPDEKLGAAQRLLQLKQLVANDTAISNSLFFTAERDDPLDLEWLLGFTLPAISNLDDPNKLQAFTHKASLSSTFSTTPSKKAKDPKDKTVKSERLDQKRLEKQAALLSPSDSDLSRERTLMKEAAGYINAKGAGVKGVPGKEKKVKDMVEAWNLADVEIWKFVRAWNARAEKEREAYFRDEGVKGSGLVSRWARG